MSKPTSVPAAESAWVFIVKVVLLSLSVLGYTWFLIAGTARIVVVAAVITASLLALGFFRIRLRLVWCLLIATIMATIGIAGSALTLNTFGAHDVASTITLSRFWYYAFIVFGIILTTRSLALRYKSCQIIESALFLGTLVYILFGHRDFNLTSPREIADYLYMNGYNPIDVYRWLGIGAAFLAFLLLFRRARFARALYSFAVLALLLLLIPTSIGAAKLVPDIVDPLGLRSNDDQQADDDNSDDDDSDDDDSDGDSDGDSNDDEDDNSNSGGGSSSNEKSDKKSNNSSNNNNGNSSSNDPIPVAVAVFYDEYTPPDGVLYFRQSVLSSYDGNHLVASTVDTDVISSMPTTTPNEAEHLQNASMHSNIATSMFLMQSHAQPPQLAMGQRVFTIQNPDPAVFVSAYGVESLGMTVDVTRLIGGNSIPATWSKSKREHYLKIPDDPRYRALSDIIVRQIDPRFAGDDIVKALYIKSWLEKEGFYTQKTRHIDKNDPTASFLFGSLRGYCVHFAHSAALLLRSQGIAARVAVGYAVDNRLRGTNSAVLILGNQAHAWPEIYVDGVGWVTFDIYPENGDEPPRAFVDRELESLFGELARDDKSGGKAPDATQERFQLPLRAIYLALLAIAIAALLAAYIRKVVIIALGFTSKSPKTAYRPARAAFFVWAMYGHSVHPYDTYEAFIAAIPGTQSATAKLYDAAIAARYARTSPASATLTPLLRTALAEARRQTPLWRRILGWINPFVFF